jgi:2'-5' RNA ligase
MGGLNGAVRAFICVLPDEAAVSAIEKFIGVARNFSGFKWVARDALHITLKFLGDMTPEQVTRLDTNLSRAGGVRPFRVSVSGAGAFPGERSPKILWLGVGEGSDGLTRLASIADRASVASGCEPERRKFHPHLTLARARGVPAEMPDGLAEALKSAPSVSWTCDSFTLMRSELAPGGAIYTPIAKFPL